MQLPFSLALFVISASLPDTLPVSAITPGAKGACHTVFVGDTVESVPFEVRGVLPGYLGPNADLIVIRLTGDKAEFTGVASGMSGSPCLLGDKVIGALSYSFMSFGKEPIAGVTPIADMLPLLDLPDEPLPWRQVASARDPSRSSPRVPQSHVPSFVTEAIARRRDETQSDWRALEDGRPSPVGHQAMGDAVPLMTPLTVSGLSPSLLRHAAPYFASHGYQLAAGTAGRMHKMAPTNEAPPRIVPGGSVSSVLVHGDVDIAGTGTVSWVQGAQVLAFGHPFMGVGPMSAPMAEANIIQILASSQHSRKQPVIGRLVGEFTQDRLSAISGRLGAVPRMVHVGGVVRTDNKEDRFQFNVARDAFWTPRFVAIGLQKALEERVVASERGTLHAKATISFEGEAPLTLLSTMSAERSGEFKSGPALDVARAFDALWGSDDAWPGDASLSVDVTIAREVHEEHVERLHIGQSVAAPRESLPLSLTLRAAGEAPSAQALQVQAPALPDGESVLVLACEGSLLDAVDDIFLGRPHLERRAQYRRWLEDRRTPGALYVQLRRFGGQAHHVQGQRLVNLPPSVAATFGEAANHDGALLSPIGRRVTEQQIARKGAVSGCAVQSFVVQRPFAAASRNISR